MAEFSHVDVLGVYAWGERVGALAPSTRARDAFVFQYDRAWARGPRHLAPLLMSHGGGEGPERDTWTFPTSMFNANTFKGLPPMIADAEEDHLN